MMRGLTQDEALRFMCNQVGGSQNYVLRQPADPGDIGLGWRLPCYAATRLLSSAANLKWPPRQLCKIPLTAPFTLISLLAV
jgi:hypothetical protein